MRELVAGWCQRGGRQLLSQLRIFDQRLHPPATPHYPHPLPESPLRLIKLDQDDTNNWLKLGPPLRPNDPYLTPFVAMVSLFPCRAPFGTVYLGSVTSVLAQSPAEHNSQLTSWERRKGYIFRRCLGNYRRADFFYGHPIHPFCSASPGGARWESGWGVLVWNVPIWYPYPWP